MLRFSVNIDQSHGRKAVATFLEGRQLLCSSWCSLAPSQAVSNPSNLLGKRSFPLPHRGARPEKMYLPTQCLRAVNPEGHTQTLSRQKTWTEASTLVPGGSGPA